MGGHFDFETGGIETVATVGVVFHTACIGRLGGFTPFLN